MVNRQQAPPTRGAARGGREPVARDRASRACRLRVTGTLHLCCVVLVCASVAAASAQIPRAGARAAGQQLGAGDARRSPALHRDSSIEAPQRDARLSPSAGARAHRSQQLDDSGEGEEGVVKTASKRARLDPANFLVVIIAAIILIYCCYRALHPPFLDVEKMSTREREEMRELEEAGEMELHSTFLFVVVASAALLLIFYFMSAMAVLITCLFSFIATISLGASLFPYVDNWTNRRFAHETDVPLLGPVPVLVFVLAPVCILTVALWLITKSWILNNVLAISLIIFFLTTIRISSLMVNTVLLVLAFFYDIFWVFCSSAVFGSNVMVTVATQLDVPIKILVPLILSQDGSELQFTLIGLGDIVLPGLLLSFAMRFDDHKKISLTSGYFAVTMTGYILGLTVCEVVVGAFHLAQPAMIYLVPGTLVPFYGMALFRGELGEAWKGIKGSSYIDIVEERP